jgi:chorismate mutase / prephenate dehydratase
MNRIESRPGHTGKWQYAFFVDIGGHIHDAAMKNAIDEARELAQDVKVLGSYPVAVL